MNFIGQRNESELHSYVMLVYNSIQIDKYSKNILKWENFHLPTSINVSL
jgi:hypothetical protein